MPNVANKIARAAREHDDTLLLFDCSMSTIPESLCQLDWLTGLDLEVNKLTALIDDFARMRSLLTLDLGFNRFSSFPEPLLSLENLAALNLHDNKLTELPLSFGTRLPHLETLHLDANDFTDFPIGILDCTLLQHLYLHNNQLSHIPAGISQLRCLERFSLRDNAIPRLPLSLAELKGSLKRLVLRGNPLTIPQPSSTSTVYTARNTNDVDPVDTARVLNELTLPSSCLFDQAFERGSLPIHRLKLVMFGSARVGKTSLRRRLCDEPFNRFEEPSAAGSSSLHLANAILQGEFWQIIDSKPTSGTQSPCGANSTEDGAEPRCALVHSHNTSEATDELSGVRKKHKRTSTYLKDAGTINADDDLHLTPTDELRPEARWAGPKGGKLKRSRSLERLMTINRTKSAMSLATMASVTAAVTASPLSTGHFLQPPSPRFSAPSSPLVDAAASPVSPPSTPTDRPVTPSTPGAYDLEDPLLAAAIDAHLSIRLTINDYSSNDFTVFQTVFISPGTVFLILFDLSLLDREKEKLSIAQMRVVEEWLTTIHMRAPDSHMMLVGTHLDAYDDDDSRRADVCQYATEMLSRVVCPGPWRASLVTPSAEFCESLNLPSNLLFFPVSSKTDAGVASIRTAVSSTVLKTISSMPDMPVDWIRLQDHLAMARENNAFPTEMPRATLVEQCRLNGFQFSNPAQLQLCLDYMSRVGAIVDLVDDKPEMGISITDVQLLVETLVQALVWGQALPDAPSPATLIAPPPAVTSAVLVAPIVASAVDDRSRADSVKTLIEENAEETTDDDRIKSSKGDARSNFHDDDDESDEDDGIISICVPPKKKDDGAATVDAKKDILLAFAKDRVWTMDVVMALFQRFLAGNEARAEMYVAVMKRLSFLCTVRGSRKVIIPSAMPAGLIRDRPWMGNWSKCAQLLMSFSTDGAQDPVLPYGLFHQLVVRACAQSRRGFEPTVYCNCALVCLDGETELLLEECPESGMIRVVFLAPTDPHTTDGILSLLADGIVATLLVDYWDVRCLFNVAPACPCLGSVDDLPRDTGLLHMLPTIGLNERPRHSAIKCTYMRHEQSPVLCDPKEFSWWFNTTPRPSSSSTIAASVPETVRSVRRSLRPSSWFNSPSSATPAATVTSRPSSRPGSVTSVNPPAITTNFFTNLFRPRPVSVVLSESVAETDSHSESVHHSRETSVEDDSPSAGMVSVVAARQTTAHQQQKQKQKRRRPLSGMSQPRWMQRLHNRHNDRASSASTTELVAAAVDPSPTHAVVSGEDAVHTAPVKPAQPAPSSRDVVESDNLEDSV